MEDLRPLRSSDKEDVLEIAKHTWEGHDYLPYFFDSWVQDKESHPTAIEKNGHVVALANLRVIDNGRTGWMEGLRVHPDYRGQGLASILTHHVVKLAREIPVESSVGNLYPQLLDSGLLPHNVIVYDWKALDVSREALEKIGAAARFWVQKVQEDIISFSLGFAREDQSGPQWSFTIYARDDSSFLDQLSHHLKMASDADCKTIFMTYQTGFDRTFHSLDWVVTVEDNELVLTLLEKTF
jgi:GNAT superfamily N-acetyltransferase